MAVTPPGGATTFDKVRDEALRTLGMSGAAPIEQDAVNSLMLLGLEQIYTRIWQWHHYEELWTVTIPASAHVPSGATTVSDIFDPMYRVIDRAFRNSDSKELIPSVGHENLEVTYPDDDDNPATIRWRRWDDKFEIFPSPATETTFTFAGYREINRSLYTYSGSTLTWQTVDLPDECIEIFQHLLQGFILNAVGQPAEAQQWVSIASSSLQALVDRNDARTMRFQAPRDEPMTMNGTTTVTKVPTGDVIFLIGGV